MSRNETLTAHRSILISPTLRSWLALGASIPVVGIPLFGLWVHRFLKDYRTVIYAATFVVALGLALRAGVFRLRDGKVRLVTAAWRGMVAGYVAGLIAYFSLLLAAPGGAEGLVGALGRTPGSGIALVASSPIFFGAWLYGALVGIAVEWLRGRAEEAKCA